MDFTPLTQAHQSQWADLLATCFNRKSYEMLVLIDWLHQMGHLVAWGAWDNDKLVAQYSSLIRQMNFNEESVIAGMSINMAVHPDYRGQGLIKLVSTPVYENIQACGAVIGLGFSNAEGVRVDRHSKSYGYQVVGQMQSLLSYLPNRQGAMLDLTDCLPPELFYAYENSASSLVQFKKSARTFMIRYGSHPFRDYKYGIWRYKYKILGIVVYREIEQFGVKGVSLMDVCGNDLAGLIECWGSSLYKQGIRFIHTLVSPASNIKQALYKNYPTMQLPYTRNPYYLTVRPLTESINFPAKDFMLWDFIGGDIL